MDWALRALLRDTGRSYCSSCIVIDLSLTHVARKILRDNLKGVTKGSIRYDTDQRKAVSCQWLTIVVIRRLARRGGVKRISGTIYDETRVVLKNHLAEVRYASLRYT